MFKLPVSKLKGIKIPQLLEIISMSAKPNVMKWKMIGKILFLGLNTLFKVTWIFTYIFNLAKRKASCFYNKLEFWSEFLKNFTEITERDDTFQHFKLFVAGIPAGKAAYDLEWIQLTGWSICIWTILRGCSEVRSHGWFEIKNNNSIEKFIKLSSEVNKKYFLWH